MAGHPSFPRNIEKVFEAKTKKSGVWKRKDDHEIEEVKRKLRSSSFSIVMPIGVFIIVFFPCYLFIPVSPNKIIYCFIISLILFISTYVYQIFNGRSLANSSSYKVCNKCFKEDRIGLRECPCGGLYEPAEFFDFIEKNK